MRSGACSVQQALTVEAASVLKQSLGLARRRGHAQVTPLHVAATLLTTTNSSSSSSLLRRACLKSQQSSSPHPLQCRALELCFNVALNRLPTTPPPPPHSSSSSSSSPLLLHTPNLSLSNALVAALKRAQAHQRRGCIEQHQQQQQQQSSFHQQQQQPLLAIKVELEQLIISILDDPSVSRVMREAGFSSTTVKTNLEEDNNNPSSSSTIVLSPAPPSFFFDSRAGTPAFLNTRLLKPRFSRCREEDLKVVMDAMKQQGGRRRRGGNAVVVVGDSAIYAEGVVSELMGGGGEACCFHSIRLHLSYVHLRLMSRSEVDAKVSDLRRRVVSLASQGRPPGGGIIIYVGDLRWAALDHEETKAGDDDDDDDDGGGAVEHLIEQVGALLAELKSDHCCCCKVWLMAAASYQTYMRCQLRHPSLETQWALQAVMVPSGGLNLSLQAPCSVLDSRVTKLSQYPFQVLEPKAFDPKEEEEEEEEELLCCTKCSLEFEKDVSIFKSKATQLPCWLQPHSPNHLHKDAVHGLRRKWNGHCRSLRHHGHAMSLVLPPYLSSNHQWRPNSLTDTKNTTLPEPHSASLSLQLNGAAAGGGGGGCSVLTPDLRTTLSLGNSLLSDAATPMVEKSGATVRSRDLHDRLQENIPWQSETIPSIVEALLDDGRRSCKRKGGTWLLIRGTDRIGKRRLARVAAECLRGSTSKLVCIDSRSERGIETLKEAMGKEPGSVVLIEDIDRAHGTGLTGALAEGIRNGLLREDPFGKEVDLAHGIFILTASNSRDVDPGNEDHPNRVLRMVIRFEDGNKRRMNQEVDHVIYSEGKKKKKKQRGGDNDIELDLNVSAAAEESDLTDEMSMGNDNEQVRRLPDRLLESIGAHNMMTMDESASGGHLTMVESFATRLSMASGGKVSVDRTAVEGLMGAMGGFVESEFERWVEEVFESSLVTVGKLGGKLLGLGIEGSEEGCVESGGFLGSVLPHKIHVDST